MASNPSPAGSGVPELIALMPGESIEVAVFLYNMGVSGTFDLSVASNIETVNATVTPSQLTLPTNDTKSATVAITVPLESSAGETYTISIVASSTTDERTDFTNLQIVTILVPPVIVTVSKFVVD